MTVPASRTPEGGYIGAPIPRREDARLLTGRGTFVDDLPMPGVAHAAMVRSPYAHARGRGVDTAAALALPGVLAVVTAADVADIQKPWPARMPSPVPTSCFEQSPTTAALTSSTMPQVSRRFRNRRSTTYARRRAPQCPRARKPTRASASRGTPG